MVLMLGTCRHQQTLLEISIHWHRDDDDLLWRDYLGIFPKWQTFTAYSQIIQKKNMVAILSM